MGLEKGMCWKRFHTCDWWVQAWAIAGLQFAPGGDHEGCSVGPKHKSWTPVLRLLIMVAMVLTGLQPTPGNKMIVMY
jgi:hypothetical protein